MSKKQLYPLLFILLLVIPGIAFLGSGFFSSGFWQHNHSNAAPVTEATAISSVPSKTSPDTLPDFEINGAIQPPAETDVYTDYLQKKKKTDFKPTVNLCKAVVTLLQNEYVDPVNTENLYKGAREEVKILLFDAGLDYSTIDTIPLDKDIFRNLVERYRNQVAEHLIIFASLRGIIQGLGDRYSTFLSPEEYDEFIEHTRNNDYFGIGVRIAKDNTQSPARIIEVFNGTPASRANIRKNDIIQKINGHSVNGLDVEQTAEKMLGKENSPIELSIKRNDKPLTISLIRRKVTVPAVSARMLEDKIGYMKIDSFREGLRDEFRREYSFLEDKGISALILDLRNNPGGLVEAAQLFCGCFLPRQSVIAIFRNRNSQERVIKSRGRQIVFVPVVVLVNGYTASSSEITAGAFKEHGTAIIIGTTTRGKGSVQRTCPIKEECAVKITIERIFTPKNNPIDQKGIEPDIVVDMQAAAQEGCTDAFVEKAVEFLQKKIAQPEKPGGKDTATPLKTLDYSDYPFLNVNDKDV